MRYAFALADLDHFKRVNDAHGHEAGDKALRQFADVLRNAVRQTDHAARWGGEEFAVLFVDADVAQALEVVERVRRDLAAAIGEATGPWFTCSFGIGDSSMVSSFEELLRITDNALYNSKDQGRDRATIAGAALSPAASAPTAARSTASA